MSEQSQHTVDRLKALFGSVNRVAEAAERKQNTVSGWRERGVPLDVAMNIARNARAMQVDVTLAQLLEWIEADDAKRREDA